MDLNNISSQALHKSGAVNKSDLLQTAIIDLYMSLKQKLNSGESPSSSE